MPIVPAIFKTAAGPWDNPPLPAKAVATLRVPLLMSVIPLIVTLGIERIPVSDCGLVSKVWIPEPGLNRELLLVIPPRKVTGEFAGLFHVPLASMVVNPANMSVPVALGISMSPLVPLPIVVVPVTVRLYPPAVNTVPSPTNRLPLIVRVEAGVSCEELLKVRL